ncbi:MAG TPA: Ppx/GppA phosphatase family protein [Balneolales bacterium]|nr:Ppx/GppA phosphatase family protein [Balneolales bacterium]
MYPGDTSNGNPRKRIAAIDLGTNSFHVIIVDIYPDGSFRTVDKIKELVGLGEDVAEHRLSEQAMERGLDTMRRIKILCDRQGVEVILAYATSAIRESSNGGDFIQKVIDETGVKILPIPGEKEAELIGYAVQHGIRLNEAPVLMMDIGGGSVEFIVGNKDRFIALDSRKIGVSRTASQFIKHDPVTSKEIKAINKYCEEELSGVQETLKKYPVTTLIGSSGTMENIATMVASHISKDTSVTLNEFEYRPEDFAPIYKKLIKMDRDERLKVTGLDSKRVDYIVPGLILVDLVIKKFGIQKIKTSTEALREGMILNYIRKEMREIQMVGHYPDPRRRSVFELLRKCDWHQRHSKHVAQLALKIFDATQPYHKMSENDRELLEYASLMHDIGYYISHRKHHKHALYLILNADLRGFKQDEIQIMGHVARYHRRSTPKKRHTSYDELNDSLKSKIDKLSGIIRVADGLDRSHYQNVKDIRLEVFSDKIIITLFPKHDAELEIWGASRKKELFEDTFNRKLQIIEAPPLDMHRMAIAYDENEP